MDTINAYDQAQTLARAAIRDNLNGVASDADIADAAKMVVDYYQDDQTVAMNVRDARNAIGDAMGNDHVLRGIRSLKAAVESVRDYNKREDIAQVRWHLAWSVISEIRDQHPRVADDASTDEIVDALIAAGLIK